MNKVVTASLILFSLNSLAEIKEISGYKVNTLEKCGGYSKVNIGTDEVNCVGVVATQEDGLKRPRKIVQLKNGNFLITDQYGWVANKGYLWQFNSKSKELEKVFDKLDQPHGLGIGPDGKVYIGERTQIFRFNPDSPHTSKEIVITGLPYKGSHPLTNFVFDDLGNLYVNVGAPSDQCLDENDQPIYPCLYRNEAVIRKFNLNSNGQYDTNYEVVAYGLRNSMGLAFHPETGNLYQAENNMDFDKEDGPKEEINLIIEGRHYGWPYCYEENKLNPKYERNILNFRRLPKINCNRYEGSIATLPSHSAPLDMLFYQGEMFPELQGKLLVSLHGYRETGHRIVSLDLNQESSYREIVNRWSAQEGIRPKGSPVGMTVAHDGSIWFVEDKNKTIMVLTKGDSGFVNQNESDTTFNLSNDHIQQYSIIKERFLEQSCKSCHSIFKEENQTSLKKLIKEGWIIPGNAQKSPLWQRTSGKDHGRQMPLSGKKLSSSQIIQIEQFIDALK